MNLQKLLYSIITCISLSQYVSSPVYSQPLKKDYREVIIVSQKKHILAEHIKGVDEFDNEVDYQIPEQWILRFKNRNGFFSISVELYNSTNIGDLFTTVDNHLYFCRRQDYCYDNVQ